MSTQAAIDTSCSVFSTLSTALDIANPVLSARRRKLLAHVPATTTIAGGQSGFSEEMAAAILAAARAMPILESPLLFADANIAAEELEMRPDGTVAAR